MSHAWAALNVEYDGVGQGCVCGVWVCGGGGGVGGGSSKREWGCSCATSSCNNNIPKAYSGMSTDTLRESSA